MQKIINNFNMAVEKAKVLTAIETKFKGKSLSKNFKNNLADKWKDKIDTDADIDQYIEDREDIVLEASSEGDRRATEAATKAKADAVKKVTDDPDGDTPKDDDLPADTPAWAKALITQNKKLSEKVEAIEAAKSAETLADKFTKDEAFKNIPANVVKRYIPAKEEDLETAKAELLSDFKDVVPAGSKTATRFSERLVRTPAASQQVAAPSDADVPAEVKATVKAVTDKINANAKAVATKTNQ